MPTTFHTDATGRRWYFSSSSDISATSSWNEPIGSVEWTSSKLAKTKHPKCRTCNKYIRSKVYIVKGRWGSVRMCSNCKFIYDTFHREIFDNRNLGTLKRIYNIVASDYIKTHRYNIKWIKSTITTKLIKCKCCDKKLTNGYAYINMRHGKNMMVCRNCEYLFQLITREKRRNNGFAIGEIIVNLEFRFIRKKEGCKK